jgi:hypothetical protein
MNADFRRMHRQLGRGLVAITCVAAVFLLLAIVAAILGTPHSVESFKSAAIASGYVAGAIGTVYLSAHLFATMVHAIRWIRVRRIGRSS